MASRGEQQPAPPTDVPDGSVVNSPYASGLETRSISRLRFRLTDGTKHAWRAVHLLGPRHVVPARPTLSPHVET